MKKNLTVLRMKKVLLNDKINMPESVLQLLNKDVSSVLDWYFDMAAEINIDVDTDENGLYEIKINGKAEKIKGIKYIS